MITKEDIILIQEVILEGGDIWANNRLDPLKRKFKDYYREKLNEQCCYCRKNTVGEFNMVLDIEHVLPKSKFERYMFNPLNLSMSCKRCNMNIKKEDISFLTDEDTIHNSPFVSESYQFIHPNLDSYFVNLRYFVEVVDNNTLIKYDPITVKGIYTYGYFKLKELEIESVNNTQGIISDVLDEDIGPEIADEINHLFET
jgi:hypothetical protein